MTTRISPPSFHKDKSYELYRQELLAWSVISELDKEKAGIAIALSLPDSDPSMIREKVFSQISIEELKQENGLDILIAFLDRHLAKDDLSDCLQKFEDFDAFSRNGSQSINEYIAMFDDKYRKLERKKIRLPSEILAFKLLRNSKISDEEKMLVLTGMDYENRETLYEQAKRSLKKFKGDEVKTNTSIKFEPAFLAENEEALLAAGYYKRGHRRRGSNFRGSGRGSGFISSQRGSKQINPTGVDGRILTCRSCGSYRHLANTCPDRNNPKGPDGNPATCPSCGSYRHLLPKCPDSWENMAKVNIAEENVVLFTGYQKQEIQQLGTEARNCAVLDSACSSTVCGITWLNSYLDSLDDTDLNKITYKDGHRVFKFGGGTKLKSEGEYTLPIRIVGNNVTVKTDVVDSDIPLLLSRSSMKKAKVKMDLENDTAVILGKDVALNLTSSGHYCIPIDKTETVEAHEVNSVKLEELSFSEQKSALLKLHRQFAHPTRTRLAALLKDAMVWKDEYGDILDEIASRCQLCQLYARTPPKPVVSMPMAKSFNEKVAMDLKQYKGRWILHIIDMWSRYTMSMFINRKKTSCVIDALMKNWVGVFGVMGSLLTDNGGEFSSDEMREITSILNIRLCTTAGMSPFQNGLCERVHAITDMMLLKLEAENSGVDLGTLLSWANMARNSLQMWNGFSSHQLVFGRNPNLPNIMQAGLPVLEGSTSSEIFYRHLKSLYETRKAYIQSEADERIRRALRSKVRAAEQVFENGDPVFYKRDGRERWLGPGKVVFQDGKVVFVRHGGVFVRVSPNRLCKVKPGFGDESCENLDPNNQKQNAAEVATGRETVSVTTKKFPAATPEVYTSPATIISETLPTEIHNSPATQVTDTPLPVIPGVLNDQTNPDTANLNNHLEGTDSDKSNSRLRRNEQVKYKLPGTEEWLAATILGKAGKNTGKNRDWYNIQDHINGSQKSLDFGKVEWKTLDNDTNEQVQFTEDIYKTDTIEQNTAKQTELQKLLDFNTYQEVEDKGQDTISTRWVITTKNGTVKARLVARGFEEYHFIEKDSPTIGKGAMRVFLTIASSRKWRVKTTDIKSAFLQGEKLDREVYIRPPGESSTPKGFIWKLRHGLYGLKDGARKFFLSVRNELLSLGCTQSNFDPAMFMLAESGCLHGIICCHVDDFLHAGSKTFEAIMHKLCDRFLAGKMEDGDFKYIGFRIIQEVDKIILDHSGYITGLDHPRLEPGRTSQRLDELNPKEQTLYRKIVGQLNWAVQGSRPDLAFEMVDMSTKLNKATVGDLVRAIKTIGRLKEIRSIQLYPCLGGNEADDWEVFVFTDAALGNLNDGKGSVGAYIIWLKDRNGNCCPIAWQAKKIKRVVRSTIAAEGLALLEGLEAAIYYRELITNLLFLEPTNLPITAFVDNRSIMEAMQSTKLVDDMRLRIDVAALCEMQGNNSVSVKWCPGKIQLANSLTKRGASGIELLGVLQRGKMPEEFM